ncbi:MAG: uroporphyrinogen-III synthase [Chitinophagales bacterium]|jgi:uroporphyrinogen-III synthase
MKKISKILISQPEPNVRSPYFAVAKKFGVSLEFRPLIEVERVSNKEFRKQRVDLNTYPAVTFTSRNSMDFYFQMMEEMRATVSQETRYFCMSEAIALYLQKYIQYRKRKVFFANGTFEDYKLLLLKYKPAAGRFLVPCPDVRNDKLSTFLTEEGFDYKECIMYRTVNADLSEIDVKQFDMMIFFSPIGVQSLFDNFPKYKQEDRHIAGFGPNTCVKIEEMGLNLSLKAPIPEARSMSASLERYLASL